MRRSASVLALALLLASPFPAQAEDAAEPVQGEQKSFLDTINEMLEVFPAIETGKVVNADDFDTSRPVVGIGFQVEDKTMRIVRVLDGSAADRAGLAVGMVVTRINGLRTADFNMDEIGRILAAIDGTITFEIEGRGEIGLVKAPIAPAAG